MKKLILLFIVSIVVSGVNAQSLADNGSINYKLELSGVDDPQVAAMFKDAGMEIAFLNGTARMDMNSPMTRTRSFTVGDSSVILMDVMTNKIKMVVAKDKANSRKIPESDYEVTKTKDTKKIAGYNATKYIVKMKDGQTYNVYASSELPMAVAEFTPYTKIDGAPLEYEMSQGPYKMKMTAESVKHGGQTSEMFVFSDEGYTRMTAEQLKGMFGGK